MDIHIFGLTFIYLTSLWLHVSGDDTTEQVYKQQRIDPTFLDTPTNVTYEQGQLARLECAVNNLGTKKVVWRRASDFNPLTIGTKTFVGNYRIHVEHTPLQKEWNLLIKKVQLDDAGKYECQISAVQRNLRRFIYLHVAGEYKPTWRKPHIAYEPDIRISGDGYVEKGGKILLVCNATGDEHPPDDLDWFKDGDKLSTDHSKKIYIRKQVSLEYKTIASVLEIDKAKIKNAGVYICRTSDLQITRKIVDILNSDTYNVKRGTFKETKNSKKESISHGIFSGTAYKTHSNNSTAGKLCTYFNPLFNVIVYQTMLMLCIYLQT